MEDNKQVIETVTNSHEETEQKLKNYKHNIVQKNLQKYVDNEIWKIVKGKRPPWSEVHLTKAERKGKTHEELMKLRFDKYYSNKFEVENE